MDAPRDGAVAEEAGGEGDLEEEGGSGGADVEDVSGGGDWGQCYFGGSETGRCELNMIWKIDVEKAKVKFQVQKELAVKSKLTCCMRLTLGSLLQLRLLLSKCRIQHSSRGGVAFLY